MFSKIFLSSVAGIFLASSMAQGQSRNSDFVKDVAATISTQQFTAQGLLDEVSMGLSNKPMTPACDPRRLEDQVMDAKLTSAQYYSVVKKYFAKCGHELSQNSSLGLLSLLKFTSYQYSFFDSPRVKRQLVTLPSGWKIPMVFALKNDPRPRPLVIFNCGLFCDAEEGSATRNYMMALFDNSPFNVVLVSNQTALDFTALNKSVNLAGWSEGFETLEIGNWLKNNWQYKDRVSSLHFAALSLAGNAAVFGAHFNDQYPMPGGKKVFDSIAAICPVISLKPTLDHLYNTLLVGTHMGKTTIEHFAAAGPTVTDIPDLLTESNLPKHKGEIPEFVGVIGSTSLQRRGLASTPETFFKTNNFWNLKEEVQTPMLVWASKDDSIVNNKINAAVMESSPVYSKSKVVGTVNLDYGNHCAFAAAYGQQVAATVLRTFVLQHSPEFAAEYKKKQEMPWNFEAVSVPYGFVHQQQTFKFTPGKSTVKVSFTIFDTTAEGCEGGPWDADAKLACTFDKVVTIPVASLKAMGARVPANAPEAESLSREFNTKVEFKTASGVLNGTRISPTKMIFRNFF